MLSLNATSYRWCRWCGNAYKAKRPVDRDGFCKKACKQAHYRAFKKYVTVKASMLANRQDRRVTRKKKTG